jgi:hypothetical protein
MSRCHRLGRGFAIAFALCVVGCGSKGPVEKAGTAVDKAAHDTGRAVEHAAEKTGDAIDKGANKVEEAVK